VIGLSGKYAILLRKRALNALKRVERAFNEGDYDVTVRGVEYAVQLYLKSIIYRVFR